MFHALVRTHHITSRKKLAALKAAAVQLDVAVLVRYGASPGLMHAQSHSEICLTAWIRVVHGLRYKEYTPILRPAFFPDTVPASSKSGLRTVSTISDFAKHLGEQSSTLLDTWKHAMGYSK